MKSICIIGGGPGGADLLRTFLNTPGIQVLGLADLDQSSPGMMLAKSNRIFTTTNYHDLINKPGHKIIFDATGAAAVQKNLLEFANEDNVVVNPEVAELIWKMVDVRDETMAQESVLLLGSIEGGIQNMERLSEEHSLTLKETVTETEKLATTSKSSYALIKETEEILHIIENVAGKTRILGINAAIEAARAGDYGRGFGVVADSIHDLAANSVQSVQSVTGTINGIHEALNAITTGVERVVLNIQKLEENQEVLTRELQASLEEMANSARRLANLTNN